ncbi:MAG: secondary thiamine-phosphate synthase enzyme YjbQ [Acidobacteriota bacterium]
MSEVNAQTTWARRDPTSTGPVIAPPVAPFPLIPPRGIPRGRSRARRLARAEFRSLHDTIRVETSRCHEFVDITDEVRAIVSASGVRSGMANVQSMHTTAAVLVNEAEPLLFEDIGWALEVFAPRRRGYRHDRFDIRTVNMTPDERPNGHAHCKASLLRTSEVINIVQGRMNLGRWQRIFLLELDRPKERRVSVMVIGCA